jgi:lipoyl(octanoyl) transferase
MKWYFLNTGSGSGQYNMDFDLNLAKNNRGDEAFFRLYRWKPYCISLGFNQDLNSINIDKAFQDNIDVVKRPTGGRAILHAEELTYSVVYPVTNNMSLRNFYCEINKALREGLVLYDEKLSGIELESVQPDLRNFYKESVSEICFSVSAKSEINFSGKKLVGSAQRKIGNTILQHGSILCGEYHTKIVDYLNLSDEEYSKAKSKMLNNTIGLEKILDGKIDYDKLASCLVKGFEKFFSINFLNLDKEILYLSV